MRSFPAGSSGGPDDIRPNHMNDLVIGKDTTRNLIQAVIGLTNLLLSGRCPAAVKQKKSGGIRPIAVGYYCRRLAAKCANKYAIMKVSEYLSPLQLRVGVHNGCEAAVHAARRFVLTVPLDKAFRACDSVSS